MDADVEALEAWLRADTDRSLRVRYTGAVWRATVYADTGDVGRDAFGRTPSEALIRAGGLVRT